MTRVLKCILLFSISVIFIASCGVLPRDEGKYKTLSPNDYGLSEAKTDIERFYALEKTHKAAIELNATVSYRGINSINIEIPQGANRIPVDGTVDFQGVTINVKNSSSDFYLFAAISPKRGIKVSAKSIDSGSFKNYSQLSHGLNLLIIEDENPWGDDRIGYEYAHKRKDILLIKNGRAVNKPVMPYDNPYSSPKCSYIDLSNGHHLVIKNLTINRAANCSYRTYALLADGYDGVLIENVTVNTPESNLVSDNVFRIQNCTNVTIEDSKINGTYSAEKNAGYGVYLNNIWNFKAFNFYGRGKWGIFGTNNLNKTTLEDCDINRFDIHCYGRDCYFKNVNFVDLKNQFSSVYGSIVFDKCVFTNFTPLVNRSSYNALVDYEVVMKDCVFNASRNRNSLFNMGMLDNRINSRPELEKKSWPNIHIKNLTVNMANDIQDFVILTNYEEGGNLPVVDNINRIDINGLNIYTENGCSLNNVIISTMDIRTINNVECTVGDVNVFERSRDGMSVMPTTKNSNLIIRVPLKENRVKLNRVKGLERVN